MNNDQYVAWVATLTEQQLLDEVMENPSNLTDSYYAVLGNALRKRYEELVASREPKQ